MTNRATLDELGLKHGTDKSTAGHGYLPLYDRHLSYLRDESFDLIEIGVHKGSSVRMWSEYFQRARIIGVDRKSDCLEIAGGGITIEVGDQGDDGFIQSLGTKYTPLVIVDDGSHRWRHQKRTFEVLFPALLPGGTFIIEDVHTSFGDLAATYSEGESESTYERVARMVRNFVAGRYGDPPQHDFESYCRRHFESVTLIKHAIVIRKRP